jgi:carboxymethylenebutenolidase
MSEPELNWMQRYAASEVVEHVEEGRISRREMMVRLVGICGSAAAATSFLAACASDSTTGTSAASTVRGSGGSGATSGTGGPTGSSAAAGGATATTRSVTPITNGGPGHVLAVSADDPDIKAQPVELPGPAGPVFGYFAQPAASGKRPGVLVIHEIFGLTDHIRDVARRLAKVGYLALAVDLASRAGGTEKAGNVAGALTQGPVADRVADLDAGLAYLEQQPDYNGKLGVVGFCFGGAMTLSYAGAQPKVAAAVPYYGPTPQPPSSVSSTNAAILAQYGETDTRVNASIPALEEAMAGKTFEKRIYPAGHAFNNDTGGAYNEAAAVEAWGYTLGWFDRYLNR